MCVLSWDQVALMVTYYDTVEGIGWSGLVTFECLPNISYIQYIHIPIPVYNTIMTCVGLR